MVIAFGNTKAGTGKSSLLLLLASYLSSLHRRVYLIEVGDNGALNQFHQRSKILEHSLPFEYFACGLSGANLLISRLSAEAETFILVEFPSEGYNEDIVPLFLAADLLVIPFCYDVPTLHSSVYFACLSRRIKKGISLLFLPNRVSSRAAHDLREETDRVLRQIAPVCAGITEHIGFQRISSMSLGAAFLKRSLPVLDLIYHHYLPKTGRP